MQMTASQDSDFNFNPYDEATRRDPYSLYAEARESVPIYKHPNMGTKFQVYSIFRHSDITTVLKDFDTFSNQIEMPMPEVVANTDPPDHTRLRGLVNKAFTPKIIADRRPRMHSLAQELLDQAIEKGRCDFVKDVAAVYPVTIIREILGVPDDDADRFKQWSDNLNVNLFAGILAPEDTSKQEELVQAIWSFNTFFSELTAERRKNPQDDLTTALVQASVEGSQLSQEELLNMLIMLLVAGNETTQTLINNILLMLYRYPDAFARLKSDPNSNELISNAVREVLRFESPVQFIPRLVKRNTVVAGQRLAAGEILFNWLASANRDDQVFANGEAFDIERTELNKSIPFSTGIHTCLGQHLSRMEGEVFLKELLNKVDSIELPDEGPQALNPSIAFTGTTNLPVVLNPL